jgi:putative transposase
VPPRKNTPMARQKRVVQSNVVYHVFNRRTDRQCLFPSPRSFDDFLAIMEEGRARYAVRHHAYCLMDSHWHIALSSEVSDAPGRYLRWLSTKHAVRFRFRSGTRGNGHVYQDRFKSLPVEGLLYYVTLIRYIEANPLGSNLVRRAEHWRWSSLSERLSGRLRLVEPGPWALPSEWVDIVNSPDIATTLLPALTAQLAAFRPPLYPS